MSNIITDNAGDMVFLQHDGTNSTLKKWNDSSAAFDINDNGVLLKTKEFDFGNPDTKKNINTIYINYKSPNTNRVQLRGIADNDAVTDLAVLGTSASYTTQKITMPAGFKGKKSFTLIVAQHGNNPIDDEFEINDIQIVYRELVRR